MRNISKVRRHQLKKKGVTDSNSVASALLEDADLSWGQWVQHPTTLRKLKLFIYLQSFVVVILMTALQFPDFLMSLFN